MKFICQEHLGIQILCPRLQICGYMAHVCGDMLQMVAHQHLQLNSELKHPNMEKGNFYTRRSRLGRKKATKEQRRELHYCRTELSRGDYLKNFSGMKYKISLCLICREEIKHHTTSPKKQTTHACRLLR